MANLAYQTIHFFGSAVDVNAIKDYLSDSNNHTHTYSETSYTHKDFPNSVCEVEGEDYVLSTRYSPVDLCPLSSNFPKVGIQSISIIDGPGEEEIAYFLAGTMLYISCLVLYGEQMWKERTGSNMKITFVEVSED